MYHEACADQFFGIINYRVGKEGQGYSIHQHALCALFQHQIIACRIIKPDVILKAGTTATFDSYAQGPCITRRFGNFGQSRKGTVGHAGRKGKRRHLKTHIVSAVSFI